MLSGISGEMSGSRGWTDGGLRDLRDRPMPDPDNQRLLNEPGRRHDRGNLRFLDDPSLSPTNNRAEDVARGGDSS